MGNAANKSKVSNEAGKPGLTASETQLNPTPEQYMQNAQQMQIVQTQGGAPLSNQPTNIQDVTSMYSVPQQPNIISSDPSKVYNTQGYGENYSSLTPQEPVIIPSYGQTAINDIEDLEDIEAICQPQPTFPPHNYNTQPHAVAPQLDTILQNTVDSQRFADPMISIEIHPAEPTTESPVSMATEPPVSMATETFTTADPQLVQKAASVTALEESFIERHNAGRPLTPVSESYPDQLSELDYGDVKKDNIICLANLDDECTTYPCPYHHKYRIYQWQYTDQNSLSSFWMDFDDIHNEFLESRFCDPQKDHCTVPMNFGCVIKVIFEDMTVCGSQNQMCVRRLSTPSSEAPDVTVDTCAWLTVWLWHWETSPGVWTQYGQKRRKGQSCSVDSTRIERLYQENPIGSVVMSIKKSKNKLNFATMEQHHLRDKVRYRIRRRPQFVRHFDQQDET